MKNRTFGDSRASGPVPALLAALLLAAVSVPSAPSGAQTGRLIPLYSWWSSDNQDHLCTTDPAWAGSAGKQKGAYRFYRQEGYLYAPDGTQPPGTVALYRWWNPSRRDFFTTSNPDWAGAPGKGKSGYQFVRLEGYVSSGSGSGRLPLKSYWSATRADNVATADPAWEKERRRAPDYRHYRIDGYLLAQPKIPVARFPQAPETTIMTAPIAEKPRQEPTAELSPPSITSFKFTPTDAGVDGTEGKWIEISWQTEGAEGVRLYEDGLEVKGRFQLSDGEFGWPPSMEGGFKTQHTGPARYDLVAENSEGKVSKTLDVSLVDQESCRVTVSITGKYGKFTDAVGVFQAKPGGLGDFLFKNPVSTVRDHRKNQDPSPYQRSSVTLPPGEYSLVPSGGGEDEFGFFGVIYKPGRSQFTCRDGNPGRLSVRADHAEY